MSLCGKVRDLDIGDSYSVMLGLLSDEGWRYCIVKPLANIHFSSSASMCPPQLKKPLAFALHSLPSDSCCRILSKASVRLFDLKMLEESPYVL